MHSLFVAFLALTAVATAVEAKGPTKKRGIEEVIHGHGQQQAYALLILPPSNHGHSYEKEVKSSHSLPSHWHSEPDDHHHQLTLHKQHVEHHELSRGSGHGLTLDSGSIHGYSSFDHIGQHGWSGSGLKDIDLGGANLDGSGWQDLNSNLESAIYGRGSGFGGDSIAAVGKPQASIATPASASMGSQRMQMTGNGPASMKGSVSAAAPAAAPAPSAAPAQSAAPPASTATAAPAAPAAPAAASTAGTASGQVQGLQLYVAAYVPQQAPAPPAIPVPALVPQMTLVPIPAPAASMSMAAAPAAAMTMAAAPAAAMTMAAAPAAAAPAPAPASTFSALPTFAPAASLPELPVLGGKPWNSGSSNYLSLEQSTLGFWR